MKNQYEVPVRDPSVNIKNNILPCEVTLRWIQFCTADFTSCDGKRYGTLIKFNVMTQRSEEKPRKLCEMFVMKEDLMQILEQLPPSRQPEK